LSEQRQEKPQPIGERHGIPIYSENPSVPGRNELATRTRPVQIASGNKAMVINPGTGEILGRASAAFMFQEEVDRTRFVKLFLDGIRQTVGLSKAGLSVFEMVYEQMRDRPGQDQIVLSAFQASQQGMAPRTYQRGLRELLEKEFLYASPAPGVFFVNIRFLFNGDRLHFVKSYHIKRRDAAIEAARDDGQQSLLPPSDPDQGGGQ
jgi:hypothetical protein